MTDTSPAARLARNAGRVRHTKYRCTIATRRKSLGLILKVVAAELGMSLGYLSQIELGRNLPHLPTAFKLARFFGCTVEDLWPGLGAEPSHGEPHGEPE